MLDLYSTERNEDYHQRSSASFCSAAVCFAGDQGLHWHLAVPTYGHQNFEAAVASQPQEQCRCLSPHPPGASINLRIVMSGHPGNLFSRSTTERVLRFRIASQPVLAVQRIQYLPPHQAGYHPNRQLGTASSDTAHATHTFALLTGAGTWSVWTAVVDSTGQSRILRLSQMGLPLFWSPRQISAAEFQCCTLRTRFTAFRPFFTRLLAADSPSAGGSSQRQPIRHGKVEPSGGKEIWG